MLILDLPLLSYFSYVILTLTILTMHLTLIFTYLKLVTDKLFSFLSIHLFFQTTVCNRFCNIKPLFCKYIYYNL
jgi:hypothetical protein